MVADSSPHLRSIKERKNLKKLPSEKLRDEVEQSRSVKGSAIDKPMMIDMDRDGQMNIRFGKKKRMNR